MKRFTTGRIQIGVILVALLAAAIGVISLPRAIVAAGSDLNRVVARYPAVVGSRIDSCDLCHTANIPDLNPFGSAYLNAGRNAAALATIEGADSDGDGYSNLVEIQALTFPGDPADKPAVVPTPTVPAPTATQPSPTPTGTLVPTTQPTPRLTRTPAPEHAVLRAYLPLALLGRSAEPDGDSDDD